MPFEWHRLVSFLKRVCLNIVWGKCFDHHLLHFSVRYPVFGVIILSGQIFWLNGFICSPFDNWRLLCRVFFMHIVGCLHPWASRNLLYLSNRRLAETWKWVYGFPRLTLWSPGLDPHLIIRGEKLGLNLRKAHLFTPAQVNIEGLDIAISYCHIGVRCCWRSERIIDGPILLIQKLLVLVR